MRPARRSYGECRKLCQPSSCKPRPRTVGSESQRTLSTPDQPSPLLHKTATVESSAFT